MNVEVKILHTLHYSCYDYYIAPVLHVIQSVQRKWRWWEQVVECLREKERMFPIFHPEMSTATDSLPYFSPSFPLQEKRKRE